MIIVNCEDGTRHFEEAAQVLKAARKPVALTGAGISVGSGIPDFRSDSGLWSVYSPDEYATLEVFYNEPAKAWRLYRALGRVLLGKAPNAAHEALAILEERHLLSGIITQNIDNLHHLSGSRQVYEIHGDHHRLQCLQCGDLKQIDEHHYQGELVPHCAVCGFPLKPNIVLFGEAVRNLNEIYDFIDYCDLLLVIGTSAQVYPAAGLPMLVKQHGGIIFEFNREQTLGRTGLTEAGGVTDYFFPGDVVETLPLLVQTAITQT